MKKLTLEDRVKKIIKDKRLIEINFSQESNIVAYILEASKDFIIIAEVSASKTLLGICAYKSLDAEVIRTDSVYLSVFSKQLAADSLYTQATKSLKDLNTKDYNAFLTSLLRTKTFVEIIKNDGNSFQGKIVDFDDRVIVLDEYYVEYDERYAHSYIDRSIINCVALNTPRLRIVEQAFEGKSL